VLSGPGRRRRIALVPAPQSVKTARDFTAATLRRWHLNPLIDDAVVIASELATNAIRHGTPTNGPEGSAALADDRAGATGPAGAATPAGTRAGVTGPAGAADSAGPVGPAGTGRVELTWCLQASRLICVVTDQAGAPPALAPEDPEAESGHGLQIVGALAVAWGWTILGTGEKAVWAALELPGAAGGAASGAYGASGGAGASDTLAPAEAQPTPVTERASRATVRDMRVAARAADRDRRGPFPAVPLSRAAG
jgi:hypothetical protein